MLAAMATKPSLQSVRLILEEQISTASRALQGENVSDESIHAARKCIKKARATLRLMRDAIPKTTYRRENAALRDAGRHVSAVRDAKVLIEALDALVEKEELSRASFKGLTAALEREREAARLSSSGARSGRLAARRGLNTVKRRVSSWSAAPIPWPTLRKSLGRVYSRGRKNLAEARTGTTPERLHEWRKEVKYLWHQLQVLAPLCPGPIGENADQLHRLSDYLGDHHDLSVLEEKAHHHRGVIRGKDSLNRFEGAIHRRRRALEEKAFVLGRRLYADRPAAFLSQFDRFVDRRLARK
jgi:CHAD domain-containing protein